MRAILLFVSSLILLYLAYPEPEQRFSLNERQREDGFYLVPETNDIAKLMCKQYGYVKHVKLTAPQLNAKSAAEMTIQIIDLRNADTSLYSHLYRRVDFFPAAGIIGYPVQIGDFNHNGLVDFYGAYKWEMDYRLADGCIVEYKQDSNFVLEKIYKDTLIEPLPSTDLNDDGLSEINFRQNRKLAHLRSITQDSFPDTVTFLYRLWKGGGGEVGGETFADLDKDGKMDLLFNADDTLEPAGKHKVFIAEYNPDIDYLEQKYRKFLEDWRTGLFCIGDYDDDSYFEFVTGSIHGHVYVFENNGDDSYQFIYEDTVSTSNAYLTVTTNDLDNNGKIEFFVGGSSFFNGIGGTRFYWFEADGANNYRKVRSFFIMGVDPLGNDEIHAFDVNQDGKDDILINYTYAVLILTWNDLQETFEIHYLSKWDHMVGGVTMYDLNTDGNLDLFISDRENENIPALRTYFYKSERISSLEPVVVPSPKKFSLSSIYPNPFNNHTLICFEVNSFQKIKLDIYSGLGKKVASLIRNEPYHPGQYNVVWDGLNNKRKEVSSGMYICVLSNGTQIISRKVLFIK